MLRLYLIAFGFLSGSAQAYGQESGNYVRDSIDFNNLKKIEIALDTSGSSSTLNLFPFKYITIEDVRFDTTFLGIYSIANKLFPSKINNYKINFTGGLTKSLGLYLNNYFKANLGKDDIELDCFLKEVNLVKRDILIEISSPYKAYGQINFKAEVFLRSGINYYAAFKIDTMLTESISLNKKEFTDEIKDHLLMPAIILLQNKTIATVWDDVRRKRVFNKSKVYENYYNRRFKIPILTQPYNKGVYKTFAEFINNAPSMTDFKVLKGKSKTISLINKNGDYLTTIKMFGYCDGEKCWILKGNYSYPLIRTGNSFEFFYTIISNFKILLAIDMGKGKVY